MNKNNKNNVRDDRLQFLAYCFIYGVRGEIEDEDDVHFYSGLIFPKQDNEEYHSAEININNQGNQSNRAWYHQFFIDTNPKKGDSKKYDTWKWLEW